MKIIIAISFISLSFLIRDVDVLGNKAIQEGIEVIWYNADYYENPKMEIFDYNDTTRAVNGSFTLKQDLPDVVMMQIQVYKKFNNDYRVFPLNMTADICPYLAKDSPDTKKFSEHSNMRKCPIKKGHYHVNNMIVQERKVPPYIPTGEFMAESTTYINKNTNLLITRSYASVV